MMIGEPHRPNPTVHIPPWSIVEDRTTPEIYSPVSSGIGSPEFNKALAALQRYLPSNEPDFDSGSDPEFSGPDSPVDAYSCDHFRMYEFKVRRCARGRSHDWTECPYAHPGEKARRRDPRKYHYSGTACPDFRKGSCRKGDSCEFAHGVFECWLHPARYRTQPCKDGANCRRRVCFFAHSHDQLRVLPQHETGGGCDPMNHVSSSCARALPFSLSPASSSPPASPRADSSSSPPMSPMTTGFNEMVASMRNLQLNKVNSLPSSWNMNPQLRCFGSPRGSMLGLSGFRSVPATPTQPGIGYLDIWDRGVEEEPVMERVESGRQLRVRMLEKLSKENGLDRSDSDELGHGSSGDAPDVGWVSELLK